MFTHTVGAWGQQDGTACLAPFEQQPLSGKIVTLSMDVLQLRFSLSLLYTLASIE